MRGELRGGAGVSSSKTIVLKFGGSVLTDQESLRGVVHEIHRWRRDDYRVLAVVSALAGVTDALHERVRTLVPDAVPSADGVEGTVPSTAGLAAAPILGSGELQAASLLGLACERAGVPACVLTPASISLRSLGPPLAAHPVGLDPRPIQRAFARDDVVLVPGYQGVDDEQRSVVFGRGGSDFTALFLARELGARCRLIKDVDGLYEDDPSRRGPRPQRFAEASYEDALATDGSILQHEAVRFARRHRLRFELAGTNRTEATQIGPQPSVRVSSVRQRRPLRVALLGLGTVGGGVARRLTALSEEFEVLGALVRDPWSKREPALDGIPRTADGEALVAHADVVVDALNGREPATRLVSLAIEHGAHVVTANKELVAADGARLLDAAHARGRAFLTSACVGGSTPVIERLLRSRFSSRCKLTEVRGVLNGSVNVVLSGLAAGADLDVLLDDARRRGLLEEDATRDLSGRDAGDKLCVVATALGERLRPSRIAYEGHDPREWAERALRAREGGQVLRQVATLAFDASQDARGNLSPCARVRVEAVAADDPLAACAGTGNLVQLDFADGQKQIVRGAGAGRWPTTESVVGDLLQVSRAFGEVLEPVPASAVGGGA